MKMSSVWRLILGNLIVGSIAAILFICIVVGNAKADISIPIVWANIAFGWTLLTSSLTIFVLMAIPAYRPRFPKRAVVTLVICLTLCVAPAFAIFQTGLYAPLTPSGPAASCLSWRKPIYPYVGRWDGETILCIATAIPILDADAIAASLGADLTAGLSSSVYTLALGLCVALVSGGVLTAYYAAAFRGANRRRAVDRYSL
jgi:hypothetical protein